MAETYWMAVTRDVPFSQYGTDELTITAAGARNCNLKTFWCLAMVANARRVELYTVCCTCLTTNAK